MKSPTFPQTDFIILCRIPYLAPPSASPHCLSTYTLSMNSPSSSLAKVDGMMQKRPGGSIRRLLTSLKLMKVSVRAYCNG